MGNCNCFEISQRQNQQKNSDILVEGNNVIVTNSVKSNNNNQNLNFKTNNLPQRGVQNPSQSKMMKNRVKSRFDNSDYLEMSLDNSLGQDKDKDKDCKNYKEIKHLIDKQKY